MDDGKGHAHLERSARSARARFAGAIRDGDPAGAASSYAAGARLLAPSADIIEGRDRIESFWRTGIAAGIRDIELVPLRLQDHGSVAYEIGDYTIRLTPPEGGSVVDRGTYLVVHEQAADGSWHWVIETFTPDGAPQVSADAPRTRTEEVDRDRPVR